jgi:hypothetical protein
MEDGSQRPTGFREDRGSAWRDAGPLRLEVALDGSVAVVAGWHLLRTVSAGELSTRGTRCWDSSSARASATAGPGRGLGMRNSEREKPCGGREPNGSMAG